MFVVHSADERPCSQRSAKIQPSYVQKRCMSEVSLRVPRSIRLGALLGLDLDFSHRCRWHVCTRDASYDFQSRGLGSLNSRLVHRHLTACNMQRRPHAKRSA